MWVHFEFESGSNPYIAKTDDALWDMICKYDVEQRENFFYVVNGERNCKRTYENCKAILRDFAIEWQNRFDKMTYFQSDLINWGGFFETYGKRFGLLREFRENGIC